MVGSSRSSSASCPLSRPVISTMVAGMVVKARGKPVHRDEKGQHAPAQSKTAKKMRGLDVVSGAVEDKKTGKPEFDRHIPKKFDKFLAVHEKAEAKAMKAGMSYKDAHTKVAVPAERRAVEKAGKSWKKYSEEVAGLLSHIEHEHVCKGPRHPHVDPRKAIRK